MGKLLRRLQYFLRHRQHQADLDEEMAFHRDMLARRGDGDGAGGANAFGNATLAREDARGVWLAPWFESIGQDLAYALRALVRQPAFAFLAIGALTAGIGLNVSLFTVYSAMALKPWAVKDPDRVVRIVSNSSYDIRNRAGGAPGGFSRAEAEHLAATARTITGTTLLGRTTPVVADGSDATVMWVSSNYFSLLGVEMTAGRGFADDEDRLASPAPVAVISHGLWQRGFGTDPSTLGRVIRLDGVPFTVVGITSPRFLGTQPERVDIWMPIASAPLLRPQDRWVRSVAMHAPNCCIPMAARLATGVTREQARAELQTLSLQFRGPRPGDERGLHLTGTEVFADAKGDGTATFVPLVAGLALVLLLACANVANLQLARGAARRREIAVRLSLGAGRARLIRQLLTESLVLAGIAAALGVLLASWLSRAIVTLVAGTPVALQLQPDGSAVIFAVGVAVLASGLSGLAPAVQATRRDAITALKEGSAVPGTRFALRTLLLSLQVAAVVMLLAAAGQMVRSTEHATQRALSDTARRLAVMTIQPPVLGYDAARVRALSLQLVDEVQRMAAPGVLALTSTPPLASGNIKGSFRLPGGDQDENNAVFEVTPGYFALMGLAIRDGRGFQPADAERPVIVVNEAMARRYWPGARAVGQRIISNAGWNMPGELEIVGVVQDALMTGFDTVEPTIFQPPTHRALPHAIVNGRAAVERAVGAVTRIDPNLRVRVQSLETTLAPRLRRTRVAAMIAGTLGTLALGFACIGMFGVFALWVRQRTSEIGIRMALGARSMDVIRLVLGTTAWALGVGLTIGLAGSIAGIRLLRKFLVGPSGIDPVTYVAVAAILVAASLAAAFIPARRATRIDPLAALRYE
jgi:predicted permease